MHETIIRRGLLAAIVTAGAAAAIYGCATTRADDPQESLAGSEIKDRLTDGISSLPEREQLVIALYYYENLTLREIGEVLGVTESRVSQLHTKAVMRLKSALQEV